MTQTLKLFEKQQKIYPQRVWGRYRILKWVSMIVLLSIYYLTPWIRWDRGPHAPHQAVLIDMNAHKAYLFGIEIWPQEIYIITGLLILAAVSLFFITSLLGRVWCGYACPQTVWTDLFVWVERLVQGNRNDRKKLDAAPLSFEKVYKKSLTHMIWLIISVATGGAWVFYFNDAPQLADQILHLNVPWSVLSWILGLTFSTYLMAGFAREQICNYACPYARFQSAMFDKNTLIIAYDQERGEPRGKHKAGTSWEGKGHCVDCDTCVAVCPMGIDIRDGLQMSCIACGLCVDACNNVMDKLHLERGLIGYSSESKEPFKLLKPRTVWYSSILTAVGCLIIWALVNRSMLDINIMHDRNPLFVKLSDGSIRNGYVIHILNKDHDDAQFSLKIDGIEGAQAKIIGTSELKTDNIPVFADSIGQFRLFITAPQQKNARSEIKFIITNIKSHETEHKGSIFMSANQ